MASRRTVDAASRPVGHRLIYAAVSGTRLRSVFCQEAPGAAIGPALGFSLGHSNCPADCWHCSLKGRRPAKDLTTDQWLDVIAQLHRLGRLFYRHDGRRAHDSRGFAAVGSRGQRRRSGRRDVHFGHRPDGSKAQCLARGRPLGDRRQPRSHRAGCRESDARHGQCVRLGDRRVERCRAARASTRSSTRWSIARPSPRANIDAFTIWLAGSISTSCGCWNRCPAAGLPRRDRIAGCEPEQVAELRQFHRDANRRGRGPKVCAFPEIESPELFGCGAGTFHLFIDPSGNVCPCDFVPLSFGNVADEPWRASFVAWAKPCGSRGVIVSCRPTPRGLQLHAAEHGYPLPPTVSVQVAAESPAEALPDYFECVAKPFGFGEDL